MIKRVKRLHKSINYASHGIWHALLTQPNMWVHGFVGLCTIIVAYQLDFEVWEWCILLLVITLILILEMINTVAEIVVDIASPEFSDLARIAKDVSAGAVLIAAIGAIIQGIILFGPRLIQAIR